MKIDDNLSELFNIEPAKEQQVEILEKDGTPVSKPDEKIEADYDSTRDNLQRLIELGTEALEDALSVAKQSDHPRAYEVVGNLVKQLADVNQQLMDIHQQKKKLDDKGKASEPSKSNVSNNNAIFVGSTAELTKMIKELTKG